MLNDSPSLKLFEWLPMTSMTDFVSVFCSIHPCRGSTNFKMVLLPCLEKKVWFYSNQRRASGCEQWHFVEKLNILAFLTSISDACTVYVNIWWRVLKTMAIGTLDIDKQNIPVVEALYCSCQVNRHWKQCLRQK